MEKAFSIPIPEDDGTPSETMTLDLNGEKFELDPTLGGQELLTLVARANMSTVGVNALISRAITNDDWDRWMKTTQHIRDLKKFGEFAQGIIELYTNFPTTAAADS